MNDSVEVSIIRNIPHKEFVRYLFEKKVKVECPSCGGVQNTVSTGAPGCVGFYTMDRLLLNPANNMYEVAGGKVYINTECNNCGHHRNFSLQHVLDWLDAQKKEDSDE